MNPVALSLALAAALLHAGWNLTVKASGDRLVGVWTISAVGAATSLPVLAVTGLPDRSVWPLVAISATVQAGYMLMLSRGYQIGDLSFVYPMARGTAPVLVTVAGVTLLGDRLGAPGVIGVLVVTAALALLGIARQHRQGLGWALAIGVAIACYTTLDAASSRINGSAIPVVAAMFVVHAALVTVIVGARRGRGLLVEFRRHPWRWSVAGTGSALGYLLVMVAATLAPVGMASAVRETSVVFGMLAGRRLLGEAVTTRQLVVVAAAVCGVALIAID